MTNELWSGFFGTIVGAGIGGLFAYLIAKFQFNRQEKQFRINEKKEKVREQKYNEDKEIQLLWQIYFDIKKDCENSKLWEKYDELLQKGNSAGGTPIMEYISETLQFIMRDLRNFFKLLDGKQSEVSAEKYNELDLLWARASQLLTFLINVYGKLSQYNRKSYNETTTLYDESIALINKHKEIVKRVK